MKPEIIRCPTCGRRQRRSTEQNRLLWAILGEISEQIKPMGRQYGSESWLAYFKTRFLGADTVQLPNGQELVKPFSSSELDKHEFSEFVERIQAWAADKGVYFSE